MKKYSFLILVLVLMAGSLACQTLTNGGTETQPQPLPPVDNSEGEPTASIEQPSDGSSFSFGESDFPMPDDAANVVSAAGTVNYQTSLTLDEVLAFYRDTYGKLGYTEREILTTVTEGVFSFVFDGDPSGQAIVIQGVDLGDGTTNVNISLQDV